MSVSLVVGLASACGDDDGDPAPSCEAGTVSREFRAEDECDAGLTCLSGVCVRAMADPKPAGHHFDGVLVAELTNVTGVQSGVALTANQTGDVYYDDVSVCAGSDC
jgi:hypothetical protein